MKNLEEDTGLQPASIRVGLRESSFEKSGKAWGWNTKKEYDEVLAYFKERSARKPAMKAEEKAPAKPTRSRKAANEEAAKPTRRRKAA